ncbi:hypothetical protein AAFN88_16785 [Pelagibius sp. CAU 1746]|uniref:hypothetical protein n=1 Tax=Pelagibius sp. CAU 1746 TaxID=3140370 RepID=UPI00325BF5AD
MRGLAVFNLLALIACSALGAWAYSEARKPLPALPDSPSVTATLETATGSAIPAPPPSFRMPPKNTYAQLATRPPFSELRRPPRAKPAPKPVAQQQAPAPLPKTVAEPQVTLVGIVISAEKSIAMVRKPGAEELLRLAKGAELEGWRVESVLPDRLLLSHGEKVLELELTEAEQGSGGPRGSGAAPRQRRQ